MADTSSRGFQRLNIGCGHRRLEGYLGIDVVAGAAVDLVAPAYQIPLPDGCADEILSVHMWEHLFLWECEPTLAEWTRLLRSGGLLVLELPDIYKCALNLVSEIQGRPTYKGGKKKDQGTMWGIYGDPRERKPYMGHRWGWTPQTLEAFLTAHGYTRITHPPTRFHPNGREHRDMRIEARRAK